MHGGLLLSNYTKKNAPISILFLSSERLNMYLVFHFHLFRFTLCIIHFEPSPESICGWTSCFFIGFHKKKREQYTLWRLKLNPHRFSLESVFALKSIESYDFVWICISPLSRTRDYTIMKHFIHFSWPWYRSIRAHCHQSHSEIEQTPIRSYLSRFRNLISSVIKQVV